LDLHYTAAAPTAQERAAVDQLLGPPTSGWEGGARRPIDGHTAPDAREARGRRHLLLPALHAVSARVGWVSEGALNYICRRLTVPPADAYGVLSFYALLSATPRPPTIVHVCDDIACMVSGAQALCADLERTVGPAGSPVGDGSALWLRSPCLGLCERAPAALQTVAGEQPRSEPIAPASSADLRAALAGVATPAYTPYQLPQHGSSDLRLLRRIGRVDPTSIDAYLTAGGYAALRRAFELGPAGVIAEVSQSKLLGRGGAAFATGRKWEAVANQPEQPHHLVCNADESEPGTFKDRVLMEEDPFALLEAMTIAAFAGGCEYGYLYVRGEYPRATRRLSGAIEQARARGFLGQNILQSGLRFDVELRSGAGAYICGEETALFNSIEGFRGEPRNKPPFPVQKGLFGKPTVVNNVETLLNVLDIIVSGGANFAAIGTPASTGTKLFCLSGHVVIPGLYEVPFGVTLRQLIESAGGVAGSKRLQAVLMGGAAGAFVTADELDTPLTFEDMRAVKATLGSGVVLLLDDTVNLEALLLRIAAFFRDESCGQCVPCRVGTARQEESLRRLAAGRPLGSLPQERALLTEMGQAMRDASICGLGQTASAAIESAMTKLNAFTRTAT